MFVKLKQIFQDEEGQYSSSPILVQMDSVSCCYPAYALTGATILVLNTGVTVMVDETFEAVSEMLNKKPKKSGGTWVPVDEFEPDVSGEDYIVSLGGDYFSYQVDVDMYKNGRWKRYGNKVQAWMPFPEPFERD